MAQYDGSIRINTHINTDGIVRGMSEIRQTIERGMSASKPMQNTEQEVKLLGDSFSDTAKKASEFQNAMRGQTLTQDVKELQAELKQAYSQLDALLKKQQEYKEIGFQDKDIPQSLLDEIDKTGLKIGELEEKISALNEKGKAFTLGADLDAEYWKQQEENLDRVIARMEERQRKEAETPPELLQPRYDRPEVESWQRGVGLQEGRREAQALADAMASVGQNAQDSAAKSNEAIASMTQELAELKSRQKELESQGLESQKSKRENPYSEGDICYTGFPK